LTGRDCMAGELARFLELAFDPILQTATDEPVVLRDRFGLQRSLGC
jgi:hypothetical protein